LIMFCDVVEKAQRLDYGIQSNSRTASWDAMEFAFRICREVKTSGKSQQIRFQLGKGLRPSMLQHAADVTGAITIKFAEPELGVFVATVWHTQIWNFCCYGL